jgi:hypothetical protein
MFERLFNRARAVARHRAAPLLEERLRYLSHLAEQGMARNTLQEWAHYMIVVGECLRLADRPGEVIARGEIEQKALLWARQPGPRKVVGSRRARTAFLWRAIQWLRFMGRLQPTPATPHPCSEMLAAFADHPGRDKGLEPSTICACCSTVGKILGLCRTVGAAIIRYLREARPPAARREVFLSCHPPFRPIHRRTLYLIVARRLRAVSPSLPHHGPHALRHACATRLLEQGLSLKEIGDHLGHRSPDTTRIYAKVESASAASVRRRASGDPTKGAPSRACTTCATRSRCIGSCRGIGRGPTCSSCCPCYRPTSGTPICPAPRST